MHTDIQRIFPSALIQIVNLNFAIWKDSTSLELKVREIFQGENAGSFKDVSVLVNASSFANGAWQVCEDKLFHEVHFDQTYAYLGNALLGFTLILNFLTRILVYNK